MRLLHLNLGGATRVMYLLQLQGGWMRAEAHSCKCRCEAFRCSCVVEENVSDAITRCGCGRDVGVWRMVKIKVCDAKQRSATDIHRVTSNTRADAVTESLRHNKRSATGNTMQLQ